MDPRKVGLSRKDITYFERITIARSGTFAYWLANLFRPERIRLLGFDMDWRQGHWNQEGVKEVDYEAHTKPVLGFWLEHFGTPTEIWRDGWVPLEEAL